MMNAHSFIQGCNDYQIWFETLQLLETMAYEKESVEKGPHSMEITNEITSLSLHSLLFESVHATFPDRGYTESCTTIRSSGETPLITRWI